MAETRDRSNFFDDSVRKRQKTKGKEEKLKDAWRKVGPFDHRGLVVEERGTGNYKSSFKSHGVVLQRQKAYLKIVENY